MRVEYPEGNDALTEFILFFDQVYRYRSARWPASVELNLPLLTGHSADCQDRILKPLLVRDHGEIVARAVAAVDERYNRHWDERLGHIIMSEAARAGFGVGFADMPFVIDEYESLPPALVRQNPAYYHCLLKDAGFESERGWVDYKLKVTPELSDRYTSALEAARRSGFDIVPLKAVPENRRVREFNDTFNDAFRYHWGSRL
jgi:hypothetical protein